MDVIVFNAQLLRAKSRKKLKNDNYSICIDHHFLNTVLKSSVFIAYLFRDY